MMKKLSPAMAPKVRCRALIGALESRFLLDGASVPTAINTATAAQHQVAIVDDHYGDSAEVAALVSNLQDQGIKVYTLDHDSGDLSDIQADLTDYFSNNGNVLDVLHFYGEGGDAQLSLGTVTLDNSAATLDVENPVTVGRQLQQIGQQIGPQSQLMIHDNASTGEGSLDAGFINNLANVLGTDVSNALTDRATRVAIIDSQVSGADDLKAALANRFEHIYTLDGGREGLSQLLSALQQDGLSEIDSLHIYSLGGTSTLQLGSTVLNNYDISNYATELGQLGGLMADSGSILLYGSNIGSADNGQNFIDSLAKLTDSHVAASSNQTGRSDSETKGQVTNTVVADWVLEVVDRESAQAGLTASIQNQVVSAFNYSNQHHQMMNLDPTQNSDPHITSFSFDKAPGVGDSFGWHRVNSGGYENTPVEITSELPEGMSIDGGLLTVNAFDVDFNLGEFDSVYIKDNQGNWNLLTNTEGHNLLTGKNAEYSGTVFDLGDPANAKIDLSGLTEIVIRVTGAAEGTSVTDSQGHTTSLDKGYSFSAISGSLSLITDTAPTATPNNSVNMAPGDEYILKKDDFGFSDDDAGDTLQNIRVTDIEHTEHANLYLDGEIVRSGTIISAGEITQGRLSIRRDETNAHSEFSFDYDVSDGYLYSDPKTVQPNLSINTPPAISMADGLLNEATDASNQSVNVSGTYQLSDPDRGDTVTTAVSYNDDLSWTDSDGQSQSLPSDLAQQLNNGKLTLKDGQWNYDAGTADLDFLNAGDTITLSYQLTATDSHDASNSDTITITINGSNDAPVVTVNNGSLNEASDTSEQSVVVSGRYKVADPDDGDTVTTTVSYNDDLSWTDRDGKSHPLPSDLAQQLEQGRITLKDGQWTYDAGTADLDFLNAGDTITLSYQLTATDSHNASNSDTLTITINGSNDAPEVTVNNGSLNEAADASEQSVVVTGSYKVADPDNGDTVTTTVSYNDDLSWTDSDGQSQPLPSDLTQQLNNGKLTFNDGQWTYDAGTADLDFLNVGDKITLSYKLTATDSHNASNSDTITITINGSNDAPEVTVDNGSLNEAADASEQSVNVTGRYQLSDPDSNDNVTSEVSYNRDLRWTDRDGQSHPLPSDLAQQLEQGRITLKDGQWNYDAGTADLDFLNAGDTITLSYQLTATDSHNASNSDNITITINGRNDAPVVIPGKLTGSVSEQHSFELDTSQYFSDPDSPISGETLHFSANNLPDGLVINSNTGMITGQPQTSGIREITVMATDKTGESRSIRYTLDVIASAPLNSPEGIQPVTESIANDMNLVTDDSMHLVGPLDVDPGLFPAPASATETIGFMSPERPSEMARTLKGTVDLNSLNIDANGVVHFSQEQQQTFDVVSLRIENIKPQRDGSLVVAIADTSDNGELNRPSYTAMMADGSSLPEWIQFDPDSEQFHLDNPPSNIETVRVQLRVVDQDGSVRVLQINVSQLLHHTAELSPAHATTEHAALGGHLPGSFTDVHTQAKVQFEGHQQYGQDLAQLFNVS